MVVNGRGECCGQLGAEDRYQSGNQSLLMSGGGEGVHEGRKQTEDMTEGLASSATRRLHFDKNSVKRRERRKNSEKKCAVERRERKRLLSMIPAPSLQKQRILEHQHEGMPENREASKCLDSRAPTGIDRLNEVGREGLFLVTARLLHQEHLENGIAALGDTSGK